MKETKSVITCYKSSSENLSMFTAVSDKSTEHGPHSDKIVQFVGCSDSWWKIDSDLEFHS